LAKKFSTYHTGAVKTILNLAPPVGSYTRPPAGAHIFYTFDAKNRYFSIDFTVKFGLYLKFYSKIDN